MFQAIFSRLGVFLFILVMLAGACPVFSQTPGEFPVTQLNLSKPASAAGLGSVTLPFGWTERTEGDDRIVVVEPSNAPAVITVDRMKIPAELEPRTVANNVVLSLVEASGVRDFVLESQMQWHSLCLDEKVSKTCKNTLGEGTLTWEGSENGVARTCHAALYLSDASRQLLIFTLCGPTEKTYSADPVETLKNMFKLMQ